MIETLSPLRKYILIGMTSAVTVLQLSTLIISRDLFPFVKYNMFSHIVPNAIFHGLNVVAVDADGREYMSLPKTDFQPYSRRGIEWALLQGRKNGTTQEILDYLLRRVRTTRLPTAKAVKVYEYQCSCPDFQEWPGDYRDYMEQKCQRTLRAEHGS
jgi:hypothetical protein